MHKCTFCANPNIERTTFQNLMRNSEQLMCSSLFSCSSLFLAKNFLSYFKGPSIHQSQTQKETPHRLKMTEVQSPSAEIDLANNLAHLFRHASEITKETKGKHFNF